MKFILQVRGYGKTYYEIERRKKKMNNEIKEILECMKEIADCTFTTDTFELNFEDTKILLDYITNLQQENERLKEIINDDMTVYLKGLEDGKEKMRQCFESIYKKGSDENGKNND